MTGGEQKDLHELSYELGRNAKGLEDLNKLFEQHCKDDDRRHEENVALLTANNDAIAAQNKAFAEALDKLTSRVALTSPDGRLLSRKQLAVARRRRYRRHDRGGLDCRGRGQMGGRLAHRRNLEGEARRVIALNN